MSLPHDLKQKLDRIAREFAQFAKKTSSGPYEAVIKAAEKIAEKADCDDVYMEDSDGEGIFMSRPNPPINGVKVYELHGDGWIPILRRSDNAFDRLCQEFLDTIADDPRAKMDEDDALTLLDETLFDSFWHEIDDIDGDELESVYDDIRDECADAAAYSRDPYAYYGVSRRDFMASRRASRTLTASDRSALIRLASTMPKGDVMRRAILAGLSKSALTVGTVRAFIEVASSKLTQYDRRLEAKQPNMYRLGHYLKALNNVREDVRDVMDDASPEALDRLRASFERRFRGLPPIIATIKQIDQYIATGKLPRLVGG